MKLQDGVTLSPLSSDDASSISSPQEVPSLGSPLSLDWDFLNSPSDKLTSKIASDILKSDYSSGSGSELYLLPDQSLRKDKLKSSGSSSTATSSGVPSVNSLTQQDSPSVLGSFSLPAYKALSDPASFRSDSPRGGPGPPALSQDTPAMRESYDPNNFSTTAMEHLKPSTYGRIAGGKPSRGVVAGGMMPQFPPAVGYGEETSHSSHSGPHHTAMDYMDGRPRYDDPLPHYRRESHGYNNGGGGGGSSSSSSNHSSNYNGQSSSTGLGPNEDLTFPCSPLLDALMGKFNDDYMVTEKSWTPQRHLSAPAACDTSGSPSDFSYGPGGETQDVFGEQGGPSYDKPMKHSKRGYSFSDIQIKEEVDDDGIMNSCSVTTSGRNKGCGKASDPKFDCQICGDIAAGFHCGAYVCEACKVSISLLYSSTA